MDWHHGPWHSGHIRCGLAYGIKVVVDSKSLELIDGTKVDFVKDGMNEVFRFRNPKVKGECGCGESFSID